MDKKKKLVSLDPKLFKWLERKAKKSFGGNVNLTINHILDNAKESEKIGADK